MKNQGAFIVFGIILLAVASFFFITPTTTGNVVLERQTCDDKLTISENKLRSADAELATCNQLKAAAIADLSKLQAPQKCDVSEFESKIADLTKQKSNLLRNLKDAQDEAKECTEDNSLVEQLNRTIAELARNSANNICCKMRVDNQNIKAYSMDGNRINCLESGDLSLSCP